MLPSMAGSARHCSVHRGSSDRNFKFTFPLWCQKQYNKILYLCLKTVSVLSSTQLYPEAETWPCFGSREDCHMLQ